MERARSGDGKKSLPPRQRHVKLRRLLGKQLPAPSSTQLPRSAPVGSSHGASPSGWPSRSRRCGGRGTQVRPSEKVKREGRRYAASVSRSAVGRGVGGVGGVTQPRDVRGPRRRRDRGRGSRRRPGAGGQAGRTWAGQATARIDGGAPLIAPRGRSSWSTRSGAVPPACRETGGGGDRPSTTSPRSPPTSRRRGADELAGLAGGVSVGPRTAARHGPAEISRASHVRDRSDVRVATARANSTASLANAPGRGQPRPPRLFAARPRPLAASPAGRDLPAPRLWCAPAAAVLRSEARPPSAVRAIAALRLAGPVLRRVLQAGQDPMPPAPEARAPTPHHTPHPHPHPHPYPHPHPPCADGSRHAALWPYRASG